MNTMTKHEVKVDIKPIGTESAVVYAPFDEAYEALTEQGYEVISLPKNAQLRTQQGKESSVSRNSNWTREGIIYTPMENPRLVRNSPILYSASEATQAHRIRKEFYPSKEQIEQALEDSIDFPTENTEIPTNRFDSDALTIYAFGGEKQAQEYGEFLRNAGIEKMPVFVVPKDYVNEQDKPFATQLWFSYLDGGSVLDGNARGWYGFLADGDGLRGVKMGAEGTVPQIEVSEAYNPRQISKVLKELGFSGLEKTLLQRLKQ